MKNNWRVLVILLIMMAFSGLSAKAANNAVGNKPTGITVTPAFQQVTIQPNESQHPVSFTITNNQAVTQTIALSTADFNTLNESGGLLFVGTNPTALQKKYGLAKWFSLPQNQIIIQPKQTISINAAILNLADMSSGGHYGALNLEVVNPGSRQTSNKVALHPIASSLLFVTKLGGDTHKLGLQSVTAKHSPFGIPGSVTISFRNSGNTHLIPRGTVIITSPSGKQVSKGIINDDSGIILPETSRKYYVPLQHLASTYSAGRYKLRVDFRFDGISQFRTYQQSFFYIPLVYIVWLLLVIVILVFGLKQLIKVCKR